MKTKEKKDMNFAAGILPEHSANHSENINKGSLRLLCLYVMTDRL